MLPCLSGGPSTFWKFTIWNPGYNQRSSNQTHIAKKGSTSSPTRTTPARSFFLLPAGIRSNPACPLPPTQTSRSQEAEVAGNLITVLGTLQAERTDPQLSFVWTSESVFERGSKATASGGLSVVTLDPLPTEHAHQPHPGRTQCFLCSCQPFTYRNSLVCTDPLSLRVKRGETAAMNLAPFGARPFPWPAAKDRWLGSSLNLSCWPRVCWHTHMPGLKFPYPH